jgi:hypothetical protein
MSDIWHVQVPGGEVRTLTLDQLDEAFQNGWIDAETLVLPAGALSWARLGDVAGLDDDSETPPPVSAVNSVAPIALDVAPRAAATHAEALPGLDDDDLPELKPRRGKRVFGVIVTLAVLGGLGFVGFTKYDAARSAARTSAAAAVARDGLSASAANVVAPQPAAAPAPVPVTLDPGKSPLTEQQKIALAEQDKARDEARKNKKAKSPPPRRGKKTKDPFLKNGNKYDPLNGSL